MEKVLYRQTNFPVLQNRVYDTEDEAKNCLKGDIELVQNLQTGLVYNAAFRPDIMAYDSTYNNEQGLSLHFRNHLEQVVEMVGDTLGKDNLVEVGCGKGLFLEILQKRGFDIKGFDPTYEGNNPNIVKKYFEPGIIQPAKGLILRHVLEHIPNPYHFLCDLKQANDGKGLIYIEVPCFEWICQKRTWFDIFYEHVNYFRLSDFDKMFGRVIKSGRFFGDQYLYIVADLASLKEPVFQKKDLVSFPTDFLASLMTIANRTEHPFCIWGGASKGVIFSLLCERMGSSVDIAMDVNPAKQGKFLPGTGLLVQAPGSALKKVPIGTPIYVMNSNYLEEIKNLSKHLFTYITID